MRRRSQLAAGIDRLATSGAVPRRSVVAGPAAAVSANRDRLMGLAALLRGGAPLYAAGVARLRLLLTDPASPAHVGDAASAGGSARRRRSRPRGAPDGASGPPHPGRRSWTGASGERIPPAARRPLGPRAPGGVVSGARRRPEGRPRSPSAPRPAPATVRSASLNGEIARQREIETRRRAERRAPIVAALESSRTRRRWEPVGARAAAAVRGRTAGLLVALARALGRATRRAGRSLGSG